MAQGIKKSSKVQAQSGDLITLESAFTHDNLWELGSGSVGNDKLIEFYNQTNRESIFEATQESNHSMEWTSSIVYKITLDRAVSEGDTTSAELYVGADAEILRGNYEWVSAKLLAKDDYVFDSQAISGSYSRGNIKVLNVEKIEDNTDALYSPKSWDSELTSLFVEGIIVKT